MKLFTLAAALMCGTVGASAASEIVTLDLTHPESTLQFDATNGMWTDTYNDEEVTLDSQLYTFMHSSMSAWSTWWGWTASNSVNNRPQTNYITYQFSGMPKGGIVLDADGNIKRNAQGAPEVSATVPYMVAYYNAYMSRKPVQMVLNDGMAHEAVGCYVALNSYAYYATLFGDGVARAFTENDSLTLEVWGVHESGADTKVEVNLAKNNNGVLSASTGWTYVDLSALGAVNELYFKIRSTDTGTYGMNTPGYFCMDKLMVKKAAAGAGAASVTVRRMQRQGNTITAPGFIALYNTSGALTTSADNTLSLSHLPQGIYVARNGNETLKVVVK